jgi:dTDP-4-amino-4,6-dideoxygalactose transaminase
MNNKDKITRVKIPVNSKLKKVATDMIVSGKFVNGPQIATFSEKFKTLMNAKSCALVSNGYAGLFLTIKAFGLKNKKILIPATSTCFAIVNAVLSSGNKPVFCSLDPETLNIDFEVAKEIYKSEKFEMIICISHFGIPAVCTPFKIFNVPIIEDAAQCLLTRTEIYSEADAVVFSFYPTKYLNALDGGAVISANAELIKIINDISYYDDQLEWDGKDRFNFRFLNLHAAFGLESLDRIPDVKTRIWSIAEFYYNLFEETCSSFFKSQFQNGVIPSKMIIKISESEQVRFVKLFSENKIEVSKEFIYLGNSTTNRQDIELTDCIWSLPFYENLTQMELQRISTTLRKYVENTYC